MTPIEKLKFIVYTEIDQYINAIYKNTTMDQNVRAYIRDIILPRFNTLRDTIIEIEKDLTMAK